MKKFFVAFAMIMASMITMAQSQFYVILKDGTGTSFPEAVVDSLTFEDSNGAKIYGFEDFANSIAQLRKEVDSLKGVVSRLTIAVDNSEAFSHEYVDLGLPSGTLWATCNLGAKKSSEYGFYMCWGETDQKSNYSITGGKWNSADLATLKSEGVIDMYHNLTDKYDAATVLWGDDWRMPTTDEFEELLNYCAAQWSEVDGVNGIIFTSTTNSKSIFLPCSGMIRDNVETMIGTRAYYIGATATENSSSNLYLAQGEAGELDVRTGAMSRSHGRTIRAVRKTGAGYRPSLNQSKPFINGHKYVDLGLPSRTLWATANVGAADSLEIGTKFFWGFESTEIPSIFWEQGLVGNTEELTNNNTIDENGNLTYGRDAAMYSWGSQWRMPTHEECIELLSNTTQELVTVNEITGWLLTAKNGKTIFFPVTDFELPYHFASYWSSSITPDPNNEVDACILNIYDNDVILPLDWPDYITSRNKTLPVRPVVNLK